MQTNQNMFLKQIDEAGVKNKPVKMNKFYDNSLAMKRSPE